MTVEEDYFDDARYGNDTLGDRHEKTKEIAAGLPIYLPSARGEGHYKMLYPAGSQIEQAAHDIKGVAFAAQVEKAQTIDQLAELGEMFNAPPNEGEGLEHYRARLLAEGMLATSEGTANDIIDGAAEVVGIDNSNVEYSEPIAGTTENGTASVEMPGKALDDAALTASEVATFLDRIAPAGCRIEGLASGTFTYLSTSDYTGGDPYDNTALSSDATLGHDGLDANGDPKDNGGTYAGLV